MAHLTAGMTQQQQFVGAEQMFEGGDMSNSNMPLMNNMSVDEQQQQPLGQGQEQQQLGQQPVQEQDQTQQAQQAQKNWALISALEREFCNEITIVFNGQAWPVRLRDGFFTHATTYTQMQEVFDVVRARFAGGKNSSADKIGAAAVDAQDAQDAGAKVGGAPTAGAKDETAEKKADEPTASMGMAVLMETSLLRALVWLALKDVIVLTCSSSNHSPQASMTTATPTTTTLMAMRFIMTMTEMRFDMTLMATHFI